MGDGDRARGVHRRAAPPENVMSRNWYLVRVVMVAGVIAGTLSAPAGAQTTAARGKEGEVQSDPIKCWWKADRTAVRVGERFGLVLTCAVIEAGPIIVVPVLNQLEPGALSITPFEVVSGARGEDMVASPWRYVQFDYSVRLLSDGFFGQDVMIPGVTVTYNLQNAGGTQGRDQTYVLPSLPMRILSLVPKSASDIRDASGQTFASIASRTVPCVAGQHPRVGLVRLRGCARDLRAGASHRALPRPRAPLRFASCRCRRCSAAVSTRSAKWRPMRRRPGGRRISRVVRWPRCASPVPLHSNAR